MYFFLRATAVFSFCVVVALSSDATPLKADQWRALQDVYNALNCNNVSHCPSFPMNAPCPHVGTDIGMEDYCDRLKCENGDVLNLCLVGENLDLTGGGSIPTAIGKLTALESLFLADFDWDLAGSLPTEIGNTRLKFLNLCCNRLNGTLPTQLGLLDELSLIGFHSNRFSGRIPSQLGALTGLDDIRIHRNSLSGPIPRFTSCDSGRCYRCQLQTNDPNEQNCYSSCSTPMCCPNTTLCSLPPTPPTTPRPPSTTTTSTTTMTTTTATTTTTASPTPMPTVRPTPQPSPKNSPSSTTTSSATTTTSTTVPLVTSTLSTTDSDSPSTSDSSTTSDFSSESTTSSTTIDGTTTAGNVNTSTSTTGSISFENSMPVALAADMMPILIGAIVGGLVLLLLIGLAIVCFVRRRHQQRHVREASAAADYFADLPTAPIQQQSEYESVHSALGLGAATTGTTATYAAAVPDTIHYGSGHMQVVYNTVPADRSSSSHYIAVTDNELLPE